MNQPPCQHDQRFMRRALQLAVRGCGRVEPNPMVGAVIVRNGRIIAEGRHRRFGGPHAEIEALANCHDPRGATMYVTLEPCSHHGKTPPCADALIAAGIGRVVVAMVDPFDEVAGRGIERINVAGIEVTVGVCETAARRINAVFLKRLATGMPYVIAKWAQTADGCLSGAGGRQVWISCEAARRQVHRIRGHVDAIITGVGTVLADDPLLTNRGGGDRQPTRIVVDSKLRTPPASQLVATAKQTPLWIATCGRNAKADLLATAGVRVLALEGADGRVDLAALLRYCGEEGMHRVLIEAGPTLLASAIEADVVDAAIVYVAKRRMSEEGKTAAKIAPVIRRRIESATVVRTSRVGEDERRDLLFREY